MRLAVISHKTCWLDHNAGYVTDGGFPLQMAALSELFDETIVVVPCEAFENGVGTSPLNGKDLRVVPLAVPEGKGIRRKLSLLAWLAANGPAIWRQIRDADAVHIPIPGDVGTIGMLFAILQRKRLFVRHCGNWLVQRTAAERFWKWSMEHFAGGRNVMLATGGNSESPSTRNPNLKWIFSTSLRQRQIDENRPRTLPVDGKLRLIIVCRQEPRKGTDIVIGSLPLILKRFPAATLDVVGDGSLLEELKRQAAALGCSNNIHFHGKVEQSKVVNLLRDAHIFCYPTSASEGFPKVVLEALSAGLPVITTRVSVLPRLMASGCGILLENRTPAALAEAVNETCLDSAVYQRMSSIAIETAKEYSLENWRDSIGATLREAWNVPSLSSTT